MKEILYLETLEQIKAISHPHRLAILKTFAHNKDKPLTVKMISDELKETPSKIHYHLKELMKNDILEIVDTREINGIIENFIYQLPK
ncbi:MAG: helix-turn-helix transcriptional regulator [Halanaerobiales bacterium]|nr:helix-turn-helix transcriptional regulator [Halanaerobiales bacterium]